MPAFEGEQVVDGVKVSVRAEPGVFPAGAQLQIRRATDVQEQQASEAVQAVRGESKNVAESYTFDIKVLGADGKEVQPTQSQKVKVSFSLPEVADENLQTQVYHVSADEATRELSAESLDVSTQATPETGKQTTAVVETTGFSLYTVEFTYNDLQYVMPGDTQVPLSTILAAVGLAGEVSAAEVSNPELFSASNETGEWVLTARQAFDTTEWLKVTINDVTYEIAVTDSETQTVSYVERHWDGTRVIAESKTHEAKPFPTNSTTIPSGWYVAEGRVQVNSPVSITGDTHLILSNKADGLFPGCSVILAGIYVPRGCTLHIYGQDLGSGDSGTLYVGSQNGAGIGGYPGHEGGDVVVHGGHVQAQGGENCAGIGSSDGGNGGTVTVNGGYDKDAATEQCHRCRR